MTFLVILAVALLLGVIALTVADTYDRVPVFCGSLLAAAVIWIVAAVLVDWLYYHRQTFSARVACEAQRMEPRTKSFSTEIVCVPAYRATKNDTLQVNGIVKP